VASRLVEAMPCRNDLRVNELCETSRPRTRIARRASPDDRVRPNHRKIAPPGALHRQPPRRRRGGTRLA
jgi:hypothetical protein